MSDLSIEGSATADPDLLYFHHIGSPKKICAAILKKETVFKHLRHIFPAGRQKSRRPLCDGLRQCEDAGWLGTCYNDGGRDEDSD